MPLNPRQLRFVDGYLAGGPASAAYRAAGYSCRTDRAAEAKASALLRHPGVAAAVEAGRQAAAASAGVNAGRVVRGLLAEAEDRSEGSSHSARVAAWTTLARHLGMLRDRQEVSGPDREPVKLVIIEELVAGPPDAPPPEEAA